jgi:hypothetical protein
MIHKSACIVLLSLLFTFFSFSPPNNAIITLRISTFPDSTKVEYFAAALLDSNSVQRDSLYSGSTNEVDSNIVLTTIQQSPDNPPSQVSLVQNYPNPFNPSTRIRFSMPKSEGMDFMIYDILGRRIASYSNHLNAGTYELEWKPDAAAGAYFYVIKAGDFKQAKK